jgi:hypothetical protein
MRSVPPRSLRVNYEHDAETNVNKSDDSKKIARGTFALIPDAAGLQRRSTTKAEYPWWRFDSNDGFSASPQ